MALALRSQLDFSLPPELEARRPTEPRDAVRLLVSRGTVVRHHRFLELPQLLRSGDLLVVNDSATQAAALTVRGESGQSFDLHLSTRLGDDLWVVEPRPGFDGSRELALPAGLRVRLLAPYLTPRLWQAKLRVPPNYLERFGRPIRYAYLEQDQPLSAYQTVFARVSGSAEMPSAGRPFSRRVLRALRAAGVQIASITLHCGVSSLEHQEGPYPESYRVSAQTLEQVLATRERGGRVVAVGTTVVRALESALAGPLEGWTERVIRPGDAVHVDALLTGFHEPRASHLDMLSAIAGRAALARAYQAALEQGYLWHEFGDVHLLWAPA